MERKVNISGIMINIVRPCAFCLGSAETGVIIFWVTHIEPPTRSARKISGSAMFIQRN